MFIPVLYISAVIHVYSTNYMSQDPHNQRFFSYLSLFTFFMLILVSGANYNHSQRRRRGTLPALPRHAQQNGVATAVGAQDGKMG